MSPVGGRGVQSLAGLTVGVTRPPTKGGRLAADLKRLGALVIAAPALRLVPPPDLAALERAAARVDEYDWVMVTSAAGVQALSAAVAAAGGRAPRRLAVVGPWTAAAAVAAGWHADMVPERYDAEGLLEQLDRAAVPLAGANVLLAVAEDARDVLREGLDVRGAMVERVTAYAAAPAAASDLGELATALRAGRLDLLTFTSALAARNLLAALGPPILAVPVAAIGPVTAGTARDLGYAVEAVAQEHTIDGLIEAVRRWWAEVERSRARPGQRRPDGRHARRSGRRTGYQRRGSRPSLARRLLDRALRLIAGADPKRARARAFWSRMGSHPL